MEEEKCTQAEYEHKQERTSPDAVMRYLKNITTKLIHLDKKLESLHCRVDSIAVLLAALTCKTVDVGRSCAKAFGQTKTVIQHLAETQEEVRADLGEYGGVIVAHSDWYTGEKTRIV